VVWATAFRFIEQRRGVTGLTARFTDLGVCLTALGPSDQRFVNRLRQSQPIRAQVCGSSAVGVLESSADVVLAGFKRNALCMECWLIHVTGCDPIVDLYYCRTD
jgi:hypothetical protein